MLTEDYSAPVKQPTAVGKVIDFITTEIYADRLKSGDRVPTEAELCTTLGISRTSVREAIKYLESQTVLQSKQGSGTYISQPEEISVSMPLNFKIKLEGISWTEIIDFRSQMEFLVLREAIQTATPLDIQELDDINSRGIALRKMRPVPVAEMLKVEQEFHERLLLLVKNRLLKEMYSISAELFNPMITKLYEHTAEGIDDAEWPFTHVYFVDAIRKRDLFLAYQVALNLIPTENFESFLGHDQYTPEFLKSE